MKKLFIIFLWLIGISLSATNYYCSPTGSDSNNGLTLSTTWKTFQHAVSLAHAGDTVFFRSGVYKMTGSGSGVTFDPRYSGSGYEGTRANDVCFYSYPPDYPNRPIFDYQDIPGTGSWSRGFQLTYAKFIHFYGFVLTNVRQGSSGTVCTGVQLWRCNNIIFENIDVNHIGGDGFISGEQCDTLYFKNCDVHNCCDTLSTSSGNNGDGFVSVNEVNRNTALYYDHCRSWDNSDDGFGCFEEGYISYDNCWALGMGSLGGDGNGFKIAKTLLPTLPLQREMHNCIAVGNKMCGITENNWGYRQLNMHVYNNFVYNNGYDGAIPPGMDWWVGWGFSNFSTGIFDDGDGPKRSFADNRYWNNLVYKNRLCTRPGYVADAWGNYWETTHQDNHNSWNLWPLSTIIDADFVSLDTVGMRGPRQADGSLPVTNFGRPSASSRFIDAGTTGTGLPYNGTAPDLGYYETSGAPGVNIPVVTTTVPYSIYPRNAMTGGNVIDDGGGTVTTRGVCWNTSINPTTANDHTVTGSGTGSFIVEVTGLEPLTTYHVRAYATNSAGTAYGSDMEFTTTNRSFIFSGNKWIMHNGKFVIIE